MKIFMDTTERNLVIFAVVVFLSACAVFGTTEWLQFVANFFSIGG